MDNMETHRFFITFVILYGFNWSSGAAQDVSAVLGQTVEVPCPCLQNKNFDGVKFTRPGVPGHVFFMRDDHPVQNEQIPEYSGRVEWTTNRTLLIHNVTHGDEGGFQCNVFHGASENEEADEIQCFVYPRVRGGNTTSPDPRPTGPAGETKLSSLEKGLLYASIIVIMILVIVSLYKKCKRKCSRNKKNCGSWG